jgi:UTP--glucose-1-phosphate uridylyltransferase
MKAVIPAAGMGTRFLPATKDSPKEMLPVLDKPAIQYVVEECVASGIDEILIITGRGKRALEDHFDRSAELERILEAKGDTARLEMIRNISDMAEIHFVRQKEPRGLGHAVLCAKSYIRDEPFAVLLGDDLVVSKVPCTKQLMERHALVGSSVIAVEPVPPERIESYGVIAPGREVEPGLFQVNDLVEKPRRSEAPSDLGILGRYVLDSAVFKILEKTPPGKNGEIQLTDALRTLNRQDPLYALRFEGKRHDLGDKVGWLKANVELGLQDPVTAGPLRAYLDSLPKGGKA